MTEPNELDPAAMEEKKAADPSAGVRLPTSGFITINVGGRIFHTTVETLKNGGGPPPSLASNSVRNAARISRQRSFSADAALLDHGGSNTSKQGQQQNTTSKFVTAQHPPTQTFFSALFDPSRFSGSPTVDPEGRLFLDRDGDAFEHVLRYLRTGKLFADEEDGSGDEGEDGWDDNGVEDDVTEDEREEWAPGDEFIRGGSGSGNLADPSTPRLPLTASVASPPQRSQRTNSRKSLRGRGTTSSSAVGSSGTADTPSAGAFSTSLLLKIRSEARYFALDGLADKCDKIVDRRRKEKEEREAAKEVVEYRTVDLTDVGLSSLSRTSSSCN
ncbi:hypothetical protein HDU93_009287 [Gonapodya sp. JEL0774]|nr:hypothetical protein HDU93_009287 [Gonapodya sp. JEL0774]